MPGADFRDIYNFYELEAGALDVAAHRPSLGWVLLKASGIFFVITLVVFFVTNYPFIRSQFVAWKAQGMTGEESALDSDGDELPDWWEEKYGLDKNDASDIQWDRDNDYATNRIEYQYGIDPSNPDSDGDGYFDGEEIQDGYNPNGIGRSDTDRDQIYDWWEEKYGLAKDDPEDAVEDFDLDGLSNLEEFNQGTNPRNPDTDGDEAGDGWEVANGENPLGLFQASISLESKDSDGDGLDDGQENFFGTKPEIADSDGDGYDDFHELFRGYDPTGSGMISAEVKIVAVDLVAPLIWSQDDSEKAIAKDLENGAIHYPGSAFPGFRGNSYITGHSSYYSWSKSPFKEIFKDLGELEIGDQVVVEMKFASGHVARVAYEIRLTEVVLPNDLRLFEEAESGELTLVTCWPLGTNWKRLMIKAKLISPEMKHRL